MRSLLEPCRLWKNACPRYPEIQCILIRKRNQSHIIPKQVRKPSLGFCSSEITANNKFCAIRGPGRGRTPLCNDILMWGSRYGKKAVSFVPAATTTGSWQDRQLRRENGCGVGEEIGLGAGRARGVHRVDCVTESSAQFAVSYPAEVSQPSLAESKTQLGPAQKKRDQAGSHLPGEPACVVSEP